MKHRSQFVATPYAMVHKTIRSMHTIIVFAQKEENLQSQRKHDLPQKVMMVCVCARARVCVCTCVYVSECVRVSARVYVTIQLHSCELTVNTIFDSSSLAMMSCFDSHATSHGVCPATLRTNKGAPWASNSCISVCVVCTPAYIVVVFHWWVHTQ